MCLKLTRKSGEYCPLKYDQRTSRCKNSVIIFACWCTLLRVIEKLVNNQENQQKVDIADVATLIMNSLAMLSSANTDIKARGKNPLKRDMNTDYSALCSTQNRMTNLLFGNNIDDQLKTSI